MGQPDPVNQLPVSVRFLNPKFDIVENMLVEHYNASLWDILPANEIKESPSTCSGIK